MTAPSSIAHYKITAKLGEGGMGAVYRAIDTKLRSFDATLTMLGFRLVADSVSWWHEVIR